MGRPILIFGYGNLSRGDDALGPLLLEFIEQNLNLSDIEILNDFQLQVEHALDLQNRELVLFVDAAVNQSCAFAFSRLRAQRDKSYTTHAISPAAVLQVYESITGQQAPPAFLLSIKGESFELGEGLTVNAEAHLSEACNFIEKLFRRADYSKWLNMSDDARIVAA
jgi:hydrogenase maturation protease